MRYPILIKFPCYSNSFINTLEEENLGNQAKRHYDFTAATVKLGFRGRKWYMTMGGSIYMYIYIHICMHLSLSLFVNVFVRVCVRPFQEQVREA